MKNILVIKAYSKENSFCEALFDKYAEGATKANNEIKTLNLRDLNLEDFLNYEHKKNPKLPTKLLEAQELITWSDRLVFIYPNWWATPPAILKLFIEVVFLSDFAFKYKKNPYRVAWEKKLKGKSSRLIVTMDSPVWYYKFVVGDPGFKMMKRGILNFCGINPVYKNYFGSVKMSSEKQRKKWLEKIYNIGLNE